MPIASRMRWVLRQIRHGRAPHIAIGASLQDPNIVTVRVTLQNVHSPCCGDLVRVFAIAQLQGIFNKAEQMHAADRGHQLSDGSSVIRFWLYPGCQNNAQSGERDGVVLDDDTSLNTSDLLPVPPPPLSDVGMHDPFGSPLALLAASQQQLVDSQNAFIASMVTTYSRAVQDKLRLLHTDVIAMANDISLLRSNIHVPVETPCDRSFSILAADSNEIADMCVSVPVDVGTQSDIVGKSNAGVQCSVIIDSMALQFAQPALRTYGVQTFHPSVKASFAQTRRQPVAHCSTQTDLFVSTSANASFDVDIASVSSIRPDQGSDDMSDGVASEVSSVYAGQRLQHPIISGLSGSIGGVVNSDAVDRSVQPPLLTQSAQTPVSAAGNTASAGTAIVPPCIGGFGNRCPADLSDSDSDGQEHNIQFVQRDHDDLLGQYWRTDSGEFLEITAVYFDNDLEVLLYELDFDATVLHPREYFARNRFACDSLPDIE